MNEEIEVGDWVDYLSSDSKIITGLVRGITHTIFGRPLYMVETRLWNPSFDEPRGYKVSVLKRKKILQKRSDLSKNKDWDGLKPRK